MNKIALYYPTYAAYRDAARAMTEAELADRAEGCRRSLHFTHRDSRGEAKRLLCEVLRDALRAYEDEIISREYGRAFPDAADDPFFESDVTEYDPGDIVDLTV